MENIADLIDGLDKCIEEYSIKFNLNKSILLKDFDVTTNCAVERTIAIVANKYIKEYIALNSNLKFYADEFQITFNVDKKDIDEQIKKVDGIVEKNSWNNCYVDGYFEYECDGKNINLFVEYKMQSKFSFAKLATDFLKYKLYTHKSTANSIFAYIIFDKNEMYPSILDSTVEKYVYLEEYITKSIPISKCYFHNNPGYSSELLPDINTTSVLRESFYLMEKINNDCDLLEDYNSFEMYTEYEKIFIDKISTFNTNVFDANILKINYNYLLNVYNTSVERGIFKKFKNIINYNETCFDKELLEIFLDDACHYKSNLIVKLVELDKYEAIVKGFSVGIEISNFIVMLVDYFVKKHDLIIESSSFFYTKNVKVNGVIEIVDVKEHIEDLVFQKIKSNYHSKDLQNDFDRAIFGLLYFIVQTYPMVYDIDENNNITSISETKIILKIISNIQTNVKLLNKIFKGIGKVSFENYREDINDISRKIIGLLQNNNRM